MNPLHVIEELLMLIGSSVTLFDDPIVCSHDKIIYSITQKDPLKKTTAYGPTMVSIKKEMIRKGIPLGDVTLPDIVWLSVNAKNEDIDGFSSIVFKLTRDATSGNNYRTTEDSLNKLILTIKNGTNRTFSRSELDKLSDPKLSKVLRDMMKIASNRLT